MVCNMAEGYKYICDSDTGEQFAIDRETGEVLKSVSLEVPEGTSYITPQQRRENEQKKKEQMRKRLSRKATDDALGRFYFCGIYEEFNDLSPETLAKLIYLCTFLEYDGNRLMKTERTQMKKSDLSEVLKVSRPTATQFFKDVSPKYISCYEDGYLFCNKNIIFRGKVPKSRKGDSLQKLRINGIRTLYQSTDKRYHKYLGYMFSLLEYVNIEYNVLCYNPMEKDADKIILMSISEFCKKIRYDIKHISDLKYIYSKITIDVDGKEERFCGFAYDGIKSNNAKICINPRVLYCGDDYTKVEVLGLLCK